METNKRIAESMQEQMQKAAEEMMAGNPKLEYQDCVVAFLLLKIGNLAEQVFFLEERISTLEAEVEDLQPEFVPTEEDFDDEEEIEPIS